MFLSAEILNAVMGPVASGPAGFNIRHEANAGANIGPDTRAVEVQLDEKSLARAQEQNNGGVNKVFAALDKPQPKGAANALSFLATQQQKGDNLYASLFVKRGLMGAAQRGASVQPQAGRRDARAMLAREVIKDPIRRVQQRHFHQLRKTFDEIAKKKVVAINPEMLPQPVQDQMIEAAVRKGETNTPFGPVPAAKARSVRGAFAKWGLALAAGSYMEGPSMKHEG